MVGDDDGMAGGRADRGLEAQSGELIADPFGGAHAVLPVAGCALIEGIRSRSNRRALEASSDASAWLSTAATVSDEGAGMGRLRDGELGAHHAMRARRVNLFTK